MKDSQTLYDEHIKETAAKAKGRVPTRGFTRTPGMTDREYRLSIRKAHILTAHGKILCGADHKVRKGSLPFLVTRKPERVTCTRCLESPGWLG
jgi:hypothetical protein